MRFLAIPLAFVLSLPALAQEEARSVGWQKVMLEQTLQERIHGVLSAYVKGTEFVSRVEIIASRIKNRSRSTAGGAGLSLGKLDMTAPAPPSHINDAEDVFAYLERVNVSVTLPKRVFDGHKAEIEKMLSETISPVTHTPVMVTLAAFPEEKQAATKEELIRSWKDAVETNALPFSVLAGALLIGLLFMRLLNIYRKVETQKIESMNRSSADALKNQPVNELEKEARDEARNGGKSVPRSNAIDAGLTSQIQSVVSAYPQKIPALVRRWIASDSDPSNEALWILPKLLPMNAMMQLAAQLDDSAKRAWRGILEEPSPTWTEVSAQEFVAHELIDDVLRQSFPLADDLRQLLEGVKTDEVAEIAAKDIKHGALLINILSTAQSARVLTLLPTDIRTLVVAQCPAIELDDVVKMTPVIRQELQKIRHKSDVVTVPFTERALELIREVGPELEGDIFDSLAKTLSKSDLQKTLQNVCPSEIIIDADSRLHRQCLSSISLSQRADLIFSSPPKRQELLLSAFQPEEQVRELLEAEIAMLEHDPQRAAKARRDADRLWRTYLQVCRRLIQSDELAADSVKPAMNEWINTRAHEEKRNAA